MQIRTNLLVITHGTAAIVGGGVLIRVGALLRGKRGAIPTRSRAPMVGIGVIIMPVRLMPTGSKAKPGQQQKGDLVSAPH